MTNIKPPLYSVRSTAPFVIVQGFNLVSEHQTPEAAIKALARLFSETGDDDVKILRREGLYWSVY